MAGRFRRVGRKAKALAKKATKKKVCSIRARAIHRGVESYVIANPDAEFSDYKAAVAVPEADLEVSKAIFGNLSGKNTTVMSSFGGYLTTTARLQEKLLYVDTDAGFRALNDYMKKLGFEVKGKTNFLPAVKLYQGKAFTKIEKVTKSIFGGKGKAGVIAKDSFFSKTETRLGLKFKEFSDWVYAMHVPERNLRAKLIYDQRFHDSMTYYADRIANGGNTKYWNTKITEAVAAYNDPANSPTSAAGMTDVQAKAVINNAKYLGKVDEMTAIYQEFKKEIMEERANVLEEAGLITKEAADALRNGTRKDMNTFNFYVPMEVEADNFANSKQKRSASGIHGLKVTNNFKKDDRYDPFAAAVSRLITVHSIAEENKAKIKVAEALTKLKDPTMQVVEAGSPIVTDKATGSLKTGSSPYLSQEQSDNTIFFHKDGKPMKMVFDPLASQKNDKGKPIANKLFTRTTRMHPFVRAFNRMPYKSENWFTRGNEAVLSLMRKVLTTRNFVFSPANFFRDTTETVLNAASIADKIITKDGSKIKTAKLIATYTKSLPGALKALRKEYFSKSGLAANNHYKKKWDEATAYGAPISFTKIEGYESLIKDINGEVKRFEAEGAQDPSKLSKAWDSSMGFLDSWADMWENASRLAMYDALTELGAYPDDAAFHTRDLLNFDQSGEVKLLSQYFLFINAGIQSSYRGIQTLFYSGKGKAVVGAAFGLGFALRAMSFAFDEDEEDNIENDIFQDEQRTNNYFLLPTGLKNLPYVAIPKPYTLFRSPISLGEYAADVVFGRKDLSASMAMGQAANGFFEALDPIGGTSNITNFAPTLARPALQVGINRAWHGGKILPGYLAEDVNTMFNEKTQDREGVLSTALSNGLSKFDILQANNPDALSPIALQYLYDQYLRIGAFKQIDEAVPSFLDAIGKDEKGNLKKPRGFESTIDAIYAVTQGEAEWSLDGGFKKLTDVGGLKRRFLPTPEDFDRKASPQLWNMLESTAPGLLTEKDYEYATRRIKEVEWKKRTVTSYKRKFQEKFGDKIKELGLKPIHTKGSKIKRPTRLKRSRPKRPSR